MFKDLELEKSPSTREVEQRKKEKKRTAFLQKSEIMEKFDKEKLNIDVDKNDDNDTSKDPEFIKLNINVVSKKTD